MQKEILLNELKNSLNTGEISMNEIGAIINSSPDKQAETNIDKIPPTKKTGVAEILNYLGGLVVFIGVVFLAFQNWKFLSFATKLSITLGSAVLMYITAWAFSFIESTKKVAQAFFLTSVMVLPVGLYVLLSEGGMETQPIMMNIIISTVCLFACLITFLFQRSDLFVVATTVFAGWFFYAVTNQMAIGNPFFIEWNFHLYRTLVFGLALILLGYGLSGNRKSIVGLYYGFGTIALLGSGISLGGWSKMTPSIWDLTYPLIVFGVIFSSLYLKSRSCLIFGTLFFLAYVVKITNKYFADVLGWPIMLIILGLLMIVIGYFAFYLNRKYLKSTTIS